MGNPGNNAFQVVRNLASRLKLKRSDYNVVTQPRQQKTV